MRKSKKIGVVILSVLVGLILIIIIGYCAKYYLIDRPKELEFARSLDTTYIKRNMSPADLIDMPTGEGNAAEDYIEALRLRDEGHEEIKLKTVEGMRLMYNTEARSLDYILSGAQKAECDFAAIEYQTAEDATGPSTPVNPLLDTELPRLYPALGLAKALAAKGDRYFVLGELQKARQIYESILTFGYHFESSRYTILQLMVGVAISAIGTDRMETFYSYQGNTEKAAKVKEYKAQSEEVQRKFSRKREFFWPFALSRSLNLDTWIRILKEDEDAMFRRKAASDLLFVFTPIRFDHLLFRRSRVSRASKALEEAMQNDEDPSVRETARNALHLVKSISDRKALSKKTPLTDFSEILKEHAEEKTAQASDTETWLEKGLDHYREGRLDEAIDAYKQALNLQPHNAKVYRELGLAYHAKWKMYSPKIKEDLKPTRPDQKTEENVEPNQPDQSNIPPFARKIMSERGISMEQLRNDPELREKLRRELTELFGNRAGDRRASRPMRSQKEPMKLQEDIPMTEPVNRIMGMLDDAKNEYELSLKLDPDGIYTFVAHYGLGKVYRDKQMYDEAIDEYKRSIALKPEYIPAYVNLAEAYLLKGSYDEAIAESERAIYINDYIYHVSYYEISELIYYNLARAYSLKNDAAQAIESLKKAGGKYLRMARDSEDFDNIKNTPGFQSVINERKR